jgi:hypothetical protein
MDISRMRLRGWRSNKRDEQRPDECPACGYMALRMIKMDACGGQPETKSRFLALLGLTIAGYGVVLAGGWAA